MDATVPVRKQQLRNRLLRLIAQNPRSIEPDSLEAIYRDESTNEDLATTEKSNSNNNSNVTPLMTACDKSLEIPLVHLRHEIEALQNDDECGNTQSISQLVNAWGHPTETSTAEEGANSAAHHALAAGFAFGLDTLEYFYKCCERHQNECGKSPVELFHSLIAQPNANKDTPLMMACVFGHTKILRHAIQRHLELSMDELSRKGHDFHLNDSTIAQKWQSIQDIFAIQNEEGLSATNLSCGHGKVDTVKLLTQSIRVKIISSSGKSCKVSIAPDNDTFDENETNENCHVLKPLVHVSHEDIKFCKSAIDDLEAELRFMRQQQKINDTHLDTFLEQRNKICKCEEILNEAMSIAAANAVNDLMSDDTICSSVPNSNCKKGKRKKSKRRDKLKVSGANLESHNRLENKPTPSHGITNDLVGNQSPFVTLQNGLVISKTQKPEDIERISDDDDDPVPNEQMIAPRSLQNVLKSQWKQQQHQSNITTVHDPSEAFNIEAQMDALCLDPSMLLLSSHGMAMELSPSQLETMQTILLHQLNAAKEAQGIQKRLLSQNKE